MFGGVVRVLWDEIRPGKLMSPNCAVASHPWWYNHQEFRLEIKRFSYHSYHLPLLVRLLGTSFLHIWCEASNFAQEWWSRWALITGACASASVNPMDQGPFCHMPHHLWLTVLIYQSLIRKPRFAVHAMIRQSKISFILHVFFGCTDVDPSLPFPSMLHC